MALTAAETEFLANNRAAAMITIAADGMPKAVRVGIVAIDGRIYSSGTRDRIRTRRLRRDPRCTLFVFGDGFAALTLETTVTILDGPDVPDQTVRMFRLMQDKPTGPLAWFGSEIDEPAFQQRLVDEGRIIYQFDITNSYGLA